jgi:hypothetical protein
MDQQFTLDESLLLPQQASSTQVAPDVPVDQEHGEGSTSRGFCIIS